MNKVVLPPLPEPEYEEFTDDCTFWSPEGWSREQLRARDLEVARVVLEAAAKVCEHWSNRNHVYVNGALRCGKDIRALEVKHHE